MRRIAAYICLLTVSVLAPASVARAAFSAASLLSSVPPLQFDEASSPAFSGNGEYVAFRGSLDGMLGIYRRNLRTGQVQVVASASSEAELDAPDAAAPSISADGRYIAFTTAHDLDSAEDTGSECPEVYVRDMNQPLLPDRQVEEEGRLAVGKGEPAPVKPYVLASAVNGSSEGLTYEMPCTGGGSFPLAGAQAAPAVALSADGQKVVFTVLSASDLTGLCTGTPVKCSTEPSQVAVRDLQSDTTTLVSATPSGAPTPGGGSFPSTASEQRGATLSEADSSAAISADGTTVAWQGTDVPAQVDEATEIETDMKPYGGVGLEVEPLWRRIADGPAATTRRLLAGAGLNFYFSQSHEITEAVEGGALAPASEVFTPPALDADGHVVALVSNAPDAANERSYEFIGYKAVPPADAYVARVEDRPGVPVEVTPLTSTPDFAANNAIQDGVGGVAISPDGTKLAFDSRRVEFALAPPIMISPPAPETAFAYPYEVNLALGTLQRVTSTYDGAPPNGDSGQISFSGDGRSLAFASTASNLFYGDVTPGVSQVYLVQELGSEEQPSSQKISEAPPLQLPSAEWLLSATASAQRDGSVLVYADVPGAGRLKVQAVAQLPASSSCKRHRLRKAARCKAHIARRLTSARIVAPTVAHAQMAVASAAQLRLRLRAGAAYGGLVAGRDGLYAVLSLSFTAPGHATLRRQIPVTFRRIAVARSAKRRVAGRTARGSRTLGAAR